MSKKNKYYMRGIGVGILVCALILIISRINTKAEISDEEIISRARALGMVESGDQSLTEAMGTSDADVEPSEEPYVSPVVLPDEDPTETPQVADADPSPSATEVTEPDPEPVTEPTDSPEPTVSPEPDPDPVTTTEPQPSEDDDPLLTDLVYVTLTVYSGNSSDTVARRAQELGLVTNYKEFDAYLVTNGYANRIRVGSFEIPMGASYEYIAKAIT